MNDTIQYWGSTTLATGVGTADPLENFRVPDKFCLRLRAIEFRQQSVVAGADTRFHVGLSKRQNDVLIGVETDLMEYQKFLAFWSQDSELTTSGAASIRMSERVELWEYDYRLVMRPTLMSFSIGLSLPVACGVIGELVPCSEGQRNAIIAWQGGPGGP